MKKINTILKKEWAEVFKNRMVLFTVVFLPLILTAIPLGILYAVGSDSSMQEATGGLPAEMGAYCPPGINSGECFQVYMVSQFMIMFMIIPMAIPATISAYSIVGEKATRSLEPLLATPITTAELLVGKSLAALLPAVLATLGAFLVFLIGAFILVPSRELFYALLDPRWLLAVLLLGPLMALLAVFVSIIVSSRVNDPRVAEQISMVVILPVLALFFGQLSGLFVINRQLILIVVVIMAVIDLLLLYLAVRLFQRETILTRWK